MSEIGLWQELRSCDGLILIEDYWQESSLEYTATSSRPATRYLHVPQGEHIWIRYLNRRNR